MTDQTPTKTKKEKKLTTKQLAFVGYYLEMWNATKAAEKAGYKCAKDNVCKIINYPLIKAEIEKQLIASRISGDEIISRMSQIAQLNAANFFEFEEKVDQNTGEVKTELVDVNWKEVKEKGYLLKKLSYSRQGKPILEFYDPQWAQEKLGKHLGIFNEKTEGESDGKNSKLSSIPAELIAPAFLNVYRDIKAHKHTEYLLYGGRGSTKSSFVSLVFIWLLINNPKIHGLAMRQVANTLRDSVYAQLVWAVNELGLSDDFYCTTSPLEITYKPTQQKIYFRGADDEGKLKSIKTKFGHIGLLWPEELDQYHGEAGIRKIEQSVMRGGDFFYEFKTWNPPRTANNWANKYAMIPKENQYQHKSDYLSVPVEWLGKTFFEEAEHLKLVNPSAYEHEYLGMSNGTGGLVFENVVIRKITDEEISQFDHVGQGMDFGWYSDPLAWGKSHYDANRRILYIFDEYKANKKSNRRVYDDLVSLKGYTQDQLIIADSAEPKSIADFREYGASIRGAEKGEDSVYYSIKWMQGLTQIVIDSERAPEHAEEFINYEYLQDKDGNYISEYPDKNNHFIDCQRYRTNLIWRRRGQ